MYICIYVYMYMYMYICILVYIVIFTGVLLLKKIETNIGEKSKLKKAGGGRRRAEQ